MELLGNVFEERLNDFEREVSEHLGKLLVVNSGMRFVTTEEIENTDFGDLLEFRNELTGNVFDFYPISILPDGQIEAYTSYYEPLQGDPVNMRQLPIDSRIDLIKLIEENM